MCLHFHRDTAPPLIPNSVDALGGQIAGTPAPGKGVGFGANLFTSVILESWMELLNFKSLDDGQRSTPRINQGFSLFVHSAECKLKTVVQEFFISSYMTKQQKGILYYSWGLMNWISL